MRVLVGYRRLLARWPGSSSFFDLLILDKSSSVLLFLAGRLVGTSVCFLHDCLWQRLCFLAAEGGEGLLLQVVVEESADDAVMDVYSSSF